MEAEPSTPDQSNPVQRPWSLRVVLAGFCLLVAVTLGVWWVCTKATPRAVNVTAAPYVPPLEEGYVGSARCAECHQEIADTYAQHPMARSVRPVGPEPTAEESLFAKAYIPGEHRVLEVLATAAEMVHSESMYDSAGQQIYHLQVPMTYVVGAGERGRAYLSQRGQIVRPSEPVSEILLMSPLNWYPQMSRWDLAPGYHADDVRRFDRRATEDCLACHAGRIATAERGTSTYHSPPFAEMAIGCERCHGPGEAHIAFRNGTVAASVSADPIIQPAHLPYAQAESVCYQCHLSATRVLRQGRSHLDFRPGMDVSDIWCILDRGTDVTADGRTRSVNHVQQMRDSRCFTESGGKLGCTSCHDPHRVPSPEDRADFYRQACFRCHANEDCTAAPTIRNARENNCIECHMPALASSNMNHVAQTDHRILRTPLTETDAFEKKGDIVLQFFGDQATQIPDVERERADALGRYIYHSRKGLPLPADVMPQLIHLMKTLPPDGPVANAVGQLAQQQGLNHLAEQAFQKALESGVEQETARSGLLDLAYAGRRWTEVLEQTDRLLQIDPGDARLHAIRGDALAQLGKMSEGISEVQQATQLNPGEVSFHEWLVAAYRRLGDDSAALAEENLVRRLQSARIPEQFRDVVFPSTPSDTPSTRN